MNDSLAVYVAVLSLFMIHLSIFLLGFEISSLERTLPTEESNTNRVKWVIA